MTLRFTTMLLRPIAMAFVLSAALAGFGACSENKPRFLTDVMAPAGSTPEQIRAFCTELGQEASDWNFVAGDPLGPSLRARDRTFAACMARHHIDAVDAGARHTRTIFCRSPRSCSLGALALLGACSDSKPHSPTDVMAPPGSTPDQIRFFCTQLGDQAGNYNFTGADPLARSLRARDSTFAACMARHHITP